MIPKISIYLSLITFLLTIGNFSAFTQNLSSSITIESKTIEKRRMVSSVWPVEITTKIQNFEEKFQFQNRKYSYSISFDSLSIGRIVIKGFKDHRLIFFIEPGEHINIKAEILDNQILYEVVGNDMNKHLTLWNQTYQPYYEAKMKSEDDEKRLDFVIKYPNSKFSTFLLIGDFGGFSRFPIDTLSKYSSLLSDEAMDCYYGRLIRNKIENASKIQIGLNIKNSPIDSLLSLSLHIGKYIVLDFWATWCRSCVKEIPELKAAHEMYKEQAHFISISVDNDKQKWERFINTKNMNWEQILDNGVITKELGVDVYPTKIIIDPDGNIIHAFRGDHPEFYKDLDKILMK